jgi:hypothetical protein
MVGQREDFEGHDAASGHSGKKGRSAYNIVQALVPTLVCDWFIRAVAMAIYIGKVEFSCYSCKFGGSIA